MELKNVILLCVFPFFKLSENHMKFIVVVTISNK